jgi:O-antigen ligase
LLRFFDARPEATSARLDMYGAVLDLFWEQPSLPTFGTGLNNSLLVMNSLVDTLTVGKHTTGEHQAIHDHYLEVLADVGVIGFVLLFTFFGNIVAIGLRTVRRVSRELAALVVGMIASILGIAVFNLADTFLYHVANAMLWFYAGLIVAAARCAQDVRLRSARPPPGLYRSQ